MKNEKDIILFSNYNKYKSGLTIYTQDGVESFFIYLMNDGTIKSTRANNSIEKSYDDTQVYDSVALSILEDDHGLYKLLFVGYIQSSTEQVEYTFHTTLEVRKQLEEFISNCPSYIVSVSSSTYQCIYKGMKLKVEYPKPNSIFEELVQSSIFGAMKKHLCDYEKWFNEPYMRDPYTFGNRINPNAIVLDNGGYLLNGEEYDKDGNKKQKESD